MLWRKDVLGRTSSSRNDPPIACALRDGWQVYLLGRGKISDDSKLEGMDSSIGGRRHVEFLKTEIEYQIQGVLDVLSLLFSFLSPDKFESELRVQGRLR